jgi:hypothetical protein
MQRYRARLPVVAAVLLVTATILFVVGTTIERSQAKSREHQEANTVEGPAGEAGEHSEAEATEGQANATTEGTEQNRSAGESGEELFGINPESAGLTAVVAAVSLLLAALLVVRPGKGCWWPWSWSWLGSCSPPWMSVRFSTRPTNPTLGCW